MKNRTEAFTLLELLLGVAALAIALSILAYALIGVGGEDARRRRCQNNLIQLAKGMATYTPEC